MLGQLAWPDLLNFLNKLKHEGKLPDNDVMLHNIETGDEYPCDLLELESKLYIAINWDKLD